MCDTESRETIASHQTLGKQTEACKSELLTTERWITPCYEMVIDLLDFKFQRSESRRARLEYLSRTYSSLQNFSLMATQNFLNSTSPNSTSLLDSQIPISKLQAPAGDTPVKR